VETQRPFVGRDGTAGTGQAGRDAGGRRWDGWFREINRKVVVVEEARICGLVCNTHYYQYVIDV
jgi:hypothetical protein